MSNEETKVCKWCGRELPIFEYGISSYNQKRRTVCKACYSERRREKQLQLKLADGLEKYNNGELVKIRRKYKKPYHFKYYIGQNLVLIILRKMKCLYDYLIINPHGSQIMVD